MVFKPLDPLDDALQLLRGLRVHVLRGIVHGESVLKKGKGVASA
jgi:hypothetical protein